MKNKRNAFRALASAVVLAALAIPQIAACSDVKHFQWTEDVRMPDGRLLVARRGDEFRKVKDAGAGFRTGWLFQKSTLSFKLPPPENRRIQWEGTLQPLALGATENGTLHLVCVVASGTGAIEWKLGRSEHHVAFQYADDGWKRIPLVDLPQTVQPNLLANTETLFIDQGSSSGIHLGLTRKAELDADRRLDQSFKSITRSNAGN